MLTRKGDLGRNDIISMRLSMLLAKTEKTITETQSDVFNGSWI